jgi:catechol 2,3-dioxygenase-like lactoylglutathione lyase family enzyme
MIGYVTLGTDDLDRSRAFYDGLFAEIGASRLMEMDSGFTLYGVSWGKPGVAVTRPYDGEPARAGNGTAQVALSPGQG